MKKFVLPLVTVALVAAGAGYFWMTRPGRPVPVDPAATQEKKLPRGGAGQNVATVIEPVPHREETETMFPHALRLLAPGATAPLVRRAAVPPPPPGTAAPQPVLAGTSGRNIRDLPAEDKLWSGVILVPTSSVLGFGHTALADLRRIEVHPRTDRRMRVWVRLGNTTDAPLPLGVACVFRRDGDGDPASPAFETIEIPVGGYRDVVFLSPQPDVKRYTVLVRN